MTASTPSPSLPFESLALEGMVQHILSTRRITKTDQHRLMKLAMASIHSQKTLKLMNEVSEALRIGRLRVVD